MDLTGFGNFEAKIAKRGWCN